MSAPTRRAARRPGERSPGTLAARTAPPLPPGDYVDRPRLRDALDAAVPRGVALVVAPAGFGKTTVLADFARRSAFPTAWLTVSPADGDLVAFVEAVAAALKRAQAPLSGRVARIARNPGDRTVAMVADELSDEIASYGGPLGLVLDDFHIVDSAREVSRLMAGVLERAPANLFVAIGSRTVPALPHARLLAADRLVGVAAEELRFTADEVALYLGPVGDADAARRLHDRTDGWAAALKLGQSSAPHAALEGYLEAEILAALPPAARSFFLRASVPSILTDDLCSRVLDEPLGPSYLTLAHESGLFVQRLADGAWRLHDLFRDFLRGRLYTTNPTLWGETHRRVADDLRLAGQPTEAISLLIAAGEHEAAADALLESGPTLAVEGSLNAIRRWCAALPAAVLKSRPRLLALQGRAQLSTAPMEALRALDTAIEACLAADDPVGAAEALAYRATRLRGSSRFEDASADCRRALELLGDAVSPVRATLLRNLGMLENFKGDARESRRLLTLALDTAHRARDRAEQAMCERSLGWLDSNANQPGQAAARYQRAAHLWDEVGDLGSVAEVRIALGWVLYRQGAIPDARTALEQGAASAERAGERRAQGYALENLGQLDREDGAIDRALARLSVALEIGRAVDDGQLIAEVLEQIAQCHLAAGREPRRAEALARQALAEADRGRFSGQRRQALIAIAGALLAAGAPREAVTAASAALAEVGPTGPPQDLARLRLIRFAAGRGAEARADQRPRGAVDWRADLVAARELVEGAPNRGFLRTDAPAVLPALRAAASDDDPGVATTARAVIGLLGDAIAVPVESDSPAPGPALPVLELLLFGRPELRIDGHTPIDPTRAWSRVGTRALLFLLEEHRSGLSGETIVERLWPDADPGRGVQQLWTAVHRLRKLLAGADRNRQRDLIWQEGGVYRLHPDLPIHTDVAAFEAAADRAHSAVVDSPEEGAALDEAERLYRGQYLEGIDAWWAAARRNGLERTFTRILRRQTERRHASGDPRAIESAERLIRGEPLSETACALLLRVLVDAGHPDRARVAYQRFAARLRKSLGVEPDPRLAELVRLPG